MAIRSLYTKKENIDMAVYNRNRLIFAIIGGSIEIRERKYENVFCKQWLSEVYGINKDDFAEIIHGAVYPDGHMVIGRGNDYQQLTEEELNALPMSTLVSMACGYLSNGAVRVYNGAIKGEPGTMWDPADDMGYRHI